MTPLRLLMFAAVCSVFPVSLAAQSVSSPIALSPDATASSSRDARAVEVLLAALANLGGPAMANPSIVTTGDVRFSRPINVSGSFTWKRAGREFRFDNPDGSVLVSGYGKPARASGGNWKGTAGNELISDFPANLPGIVIARALADTRYDIRSLAPRELNGRSSNVVSVSRVYQDDTDGFFAGLTRRTFYIDAISNSLLRVEYEIPDDVYVGTRVPIAIDYQQFAILSGLNVPLRFTISINGELFATYAIKTVAQTAIPAQEFAGGAQ